MTSGTPSTLSVCRRARFRLARRARLCEDAEQLADVAREARIAHGTVRAVNEFRGSRLIVSGVPERVAQRIRNVVGVHGR